MNQQQPSFDIPVFGTVPPVVEPPKPDGVEAAPTLGEDTGPAMVPRVFRGRPDLVVDPVLAAEANAAAGKFDRIWIWHDKAAAAASYASDLIQRHGTTTNPGGARIIGPSRCGKTSIVRRLLKAFPPTFDERPIVPVLHVAADANVTPLSLVETMLKKLRVAYAERKVARKLEARLIDAMKGRGVKLIVIDEAQHAAEGGRTKSAYAFGDALKRIYDESQTPMILMGTQKLSRLFELNDQIGQRLSTELLMTPFLYGADLFNTLSVMQGHLPVHNKVKLDDDAIAFAIWKATEGRMGAIVQLMKEAVRRVIVTRAGSMKQEHLAVAFTRCMGPDRVNPFTQNPDDLQAELTTLLAGKTST